MRRLLSALVLAGAPAFCAAAGGTWDGIYDCQATVRGSVSQVYVTVNGQPDGRAIYSVAAVNPTTAFYGYGIGSVAPGSFSGTTMFGKPFSMSANTLGFTGSVGIVFNGITYTASVFCSKIW